MNGHRPQMDDPRREMTPAELVEAIRTWATAQGYTTEVKPATSEYAKVTVRDPNGGFTRTLIPNAHRGRRLLRHQVRYVVQKLNQNWEG